VGVLDVIDKMIGIERSSGSSRCEPYSMPASRESLFDAPVSEPDWLQGGSSGTAHKASGRCESAQRITVPEAIRLYTMGGAWQDHMEKRKGSLEPGKLADFCVLDRDILSVDPEEIHTLKNVATVVAGRRVFEDGL
jgi:predicted amidohydrolase YtcJ